MNNPKDHNPLAKSLVESANKNKLGNRAVAKAVIKNAALHANYQRWLDTRKRGERYCDDQYSDTLEGDRE